jgi:hypothetical protein
VATDSFHQRDTLHVEGGDRLDAVMQLVAGQELKARVGGHVNWTSFAQQYGKADVVPLEPQPGDEKFGFVMRVPVTVTATGVVEVAVEGDQHVIAGIGLRPLGNEEVGQA